MIYLRLSLTTTRRFSRETQANFIVWMIVQHFQSYQRVGIPKLISQIWWPTALHHRQAIHALNKFWRYRPKQRPWHRDARAKAPLSSTNTKSRVTTSATIQLPLPHRPLEEQQSPNNDPLQTNLPLEVDPHVPSGLTGTDGSTSHAPE